MDTGKIGAFLASLRHERGLTQEALGQKLGVTNKTVSRWENGNYLPDVEMLQRLGVEYGVSIEEILCGRRLSEQEFRGAAEETLVTVLRESPFSVRERFSYWRRKWLREHTALLAFCAAAAVLSLVLLLRRGATWCFGVWALAAFFLYGTLHNRMMAYVEERTFLPGTMNESEMNR